MPLTPRLALFLFLSCSLFLHYPAGQAAAADIRILYTNDNQGELEPCG
jgi:hypothetical protein